MLLITLKFLCQIDWKVKGSILSKNPVVIVSNHQGLWESFYLQTLVSPLTTIIKKELIYVPFFGWALNLLNPIKIDRSKKIQSAKRVIAKGSEKLEDGYSVLVFPEGTRSQKGKLQEAQKGLGLLVVKSGASVIPARISGTNEVLGKGMMFPRLGRKVELRLGKEIHKNQLIDTDVIKERYQNISDKVMSEISLL